MYNVFTLKLHAERIGVCFVVLVDYLFKINEPDKKAVRNISFVYYL